MYISLWVLIPAVLLFVAVVIEATRTNGRIEEKHRALHLATLDIEAKRAALRAAQAEIDTLRHDMKTERAYSDRAAAALSHLQDIAWQEESTVLQDAAREALNFYYDMNKGSRDAPWMR